MSRRLWQDLLTAAVGIVCSAFVLWHLEPSLLFADNTPTGGDMGAHVWGPAFLRDHLLPKFRISGWAPDWYAGFPAYAFYFPLPSLLIVLLDLFLPYGVAFKLVTALGPVSLPVALLLFGRLANLRFPAPPLLAVATLPFLFDTSFTIYGGNIPSMLAGEFSFSIALSLAMLYLGVVARGLQNGKHRAWAAVLLALTALSHLIPTVFAVLASGALLALRFDRQRLRFLATSGAVAFALAGFWALPLLARLAFTNDMGWGKVTEYFSALFPGHLTWVLPLAGAGLVAAIGLRLHSAMAVAIMAGVAGTAFVLLPEGRLWNARMLPFWFLCLYLLAGIGVSEVGRSLGGVFSRDPDRPATWPQPATAIVALLAVLALVGGPLRALPERLPIRPGQMSFVPDWARWNYTGYEGKDAYPEYRALIDTMGRLPCGRAMWEYDSGLSRYGTPMALMLLPYWTDGCISSMEGLFFESTPTVPFHFLAQSELSARPSRPQRGLPYRDLDVDAGVRALQLMGVRYYMAFSEEALEQARRNPDLTSVAHSGPWEIFEVADSPLVEPLGFEPAVVEGAGSGERWLEVAIPFYQSLDREVFLSADGPPEWSRVERNRSPPRTQVIPARVTGVRSDTDSVEFEVDRPGSPVLVKVSYFPNWKASGAQGPYRVAPNLMVVVPTAEKVRLHYGYTPVDLMGWLLTLLGLAALFFIGRRPLTFPQPRDIPESPEPRELGEQPGLLQPSLPEEAGEEPPQAGPAGVRITLRGFGAVTLAVTALDLSLLVALRTLTGMPVIFANAIAISAAAIVSYLIHRWISFGDDPHVRWVREPATFFWVTGAAGMVDIAVIRVAVEILGSTAVAPLVVSKAISVAAAGAVRFFGYRSRLFLTVWDTQSRPHPRPPAPGPIRLSVVIPAYREEGRIGEVVGRVREALQPLGGGFEVIVADDGSPDSTAHEARAGGADQVVSLPHNRGKGAAVRAGVLAARGRTIVFTDADLSYSPDQIPRIVRLVESGWDIVSGSRKHIDTKTLVQARRLRALGGRIYNTLTRAILLGQYRDTQCGLKGFRSDVAQTLFSRTRLDGFAFDVEVFHLAERYRLSVREIPVQLAESSVSTVRLTLDAVRMIRDLFLVRIWSGRGLYDFGPGVGSAGSPVAVEDERMQEIAERVLPIPEALRGRDLTPWVIGGLGVVWAATFIYLGARKHYAFATFGFDLGIYDQGLWLLSRFKEPFITIRGLNFFGHHMNPALFLLVPFYWIGNGPMVLLAAQTIAQAAAAFALYRIARHRLEDTWPAVVLGAALLLHPSWQWQVWWFFHPEVIGAALLVFAYWAAIRDRWGWFALTAALAVGTKEEVAFAVGALGLLIALRGRWKPGLTTLGATAVWFLGSTELILPAFNEGRRPWYFGFFGEFGTTPFEVARTTLTRPGRTLSVLALGDRIEYLKHMFAPLAFLPLARLDVVLVGGAMLGINLLSSIHYHRDLRYQYSAVVVAVLAVATVEAISFVGRTRTVRRALVGALAVISLLGSIAWGPAPFGRQFQAAWPGEDPGRDTKRRAVALIPPGAATSATYYFSPHLSDRERIYEFPAPWTPANWGIEGENLHDPAGVEWLIVDRSPLGPEHAERLDRLLATEFRPVFDERGIVVARRR